MAATVVDLLLAGRRGPCRIIDGTIGNGGHSSLILQTNTAAEVLGIDRDDEALARAKTMLAFAESRVRLVHDRYSRLAARATEQRWRSVDAVLLDLGVSSPQLDDARRGFSHRLDGPLDMRMDRESGMTASRILNFTEEEELARIFYQYGEIRESRRLARAVVQRREQQPFQRTGEFAALCADVCGRSRRSLPAATLAFQALRIAVNEELAELEQGLAAATDLLAPGGRLAVISFHSLEDRRVKQFFRRESTTCLCPPGLPVCICHHRPRLREITRKPVVANAAEVAANPRTACAKLRVAERLDADGNRLADPTAELTSENPREALDR
jgi:16S rRNA (cytosine1402-N4)-methyltransferase